MQLQANATYISARELFTSIYIIHFYNLKQIPHDAFLDTPVDLFLEYQIATLFIFISTT